MYCKYLRWIIFNIHWLCLVLFASMMVPSITLSAEDEVVFEKTIRFPMTMCRREWKTIIFICQTDGCWLVRMKRKAQSTAYESLLHESHIWQYFFGFFFYCLKEKFKKEEICNTWHTMSCFGSKWRWQMSKRSIKKKPFENDDEEKRWLKNVLIGYRGWCLVLSAFCLVTVDNINGDLWADALFSDD